MDTGIKAIRAHTYQQAFAPQSEIGPAIPYPHKNLFVPGQESCKNGIVIKLCTFIIIFEYINLINLLLYLFLYYDINSLFYYSV